MGVESLDDLGKVGERTGEAVDLVDDDHLDTARFDVREQLLETRAPHVAAGKSTIVVVGADGLPAFMFLALDIGLAGFPLRIERVEFLLESLLRRLAGIDGAVEFGTITRHRLFPSR